MLPRGTAAIARTVPEPAAFVVRALDLARMARKMTAPRMADLRNIYDRDEVLAA